MANEKDPQVAMREAAARGARSADEHGKPGEASTRKAADAAKDMVEEQGRAAHETVEQGADTARRATDAAADATRRGTEATAEAAKRTAEMAGDTTRRAMDAGAELTRRGTETFRDTSRELTGTALRLAGQQTEQFQRLLGLSANGQGEAVQQAKQNMDAIVQCSSALMDGMQSVWREWLALSQETMQRHVDGMGSVMRSRSLHDFYAAQSGLLKDEMRMVLDRSVKISEMSARAADTAVRQLGERGERQGDGDVYRRA